MHRTLPALKGLFLASTAVIACGVVAAPAMVQAQTRAISIPAQPLGGAIQALSEQTDAVIVAPGVRMDGRRSTAVVNAASVDQALTALLRGTGLSFRKDANNAYVIAASAPRPTQETPVSRRAAATPTALTTTQAADPLAATLDDIVVTARRMEERIIDVPVAVSAFSAEQLDERKIEGGSELLRVVPNVNFSKDNFTGYNFSIRGIGAKVLATTADPGVAISFNNTALLRNRLFEQEYFDVQRLEVLRGPQGTLYGRNATAGVVNMLPNLPELGEFSSEVQGELGNFGTERLRGHVNIPLGDTLALRMAGALTKRDGFDYNTVTERNVNGRDLWATRVGLLWQPTEDFRANFLWERFREDDDRARTGKMLCTRGELPTSFDWTSPTGAAMTTPITGFRHSTSLAPGCTASSLYADEAYGVPDGRGWSPTFSLSNMIAFNAAPRPGSGSQNGFDGSYLFPLPVDPFGVEGNRQIADLRTISTAYDPRFKADNDVFQLNLEWSLGSGLTLFSQTLYMEDSYSGRQDFFRTYATGQMYRWETPGLVNGVPRTLQAAWAPWIGDSNPIAGVYNHPTLGPIPTGGVFLDPQLGATDRFMAVDRSDAESSQWSQEFRLQSDFDGRFNFNLGANWLRYETEENYYVFSNLFTMMAVQQNLSDFRSGDFDQYCNLTAQGQTKVNAGTLDPNVCAYIDPNPLGEINGEGHNYIRSTSINRTESWAVFGEGYWTLRDDLRLTLGLRYTDDTKTMTPVPSQFLADTSATNSGLVGRGYPRYPDEKLNWGEWTGRAAFDWKPDLSFTEDTLVYASYSRGYKGGGGNPRDRDYNPKLINVPSLPSRYDAEFVNAYEIGTKNMLAEGKLMVNATAFFYDYENYQVAQLMERAIHNENFDAKIWGAEFETAWKPTRNFRLDATLGLLKTRIGDGEESIDVMDRLQGHDDWVVMKPWPGSPSTCIVPRDIIGRYLNLYETPTPVEFGSPLIRTLCPDRQLGGAWVPGSGGLYDYASRWRDQWQALYPFAFDPLTAPNGSRGFAADLSGHELPNAPHVTFNVGAQYRFELPQGWDLMLRGDYYRQSESWMRVYNNAPYDRLKSWANANLSITLTSPNADLAVQAYVKNVFDDTPITDGFTGPDELGNFTNVFTLDPRIVGVSVRKSF